MPTQNDTKKSDDLQVSDASTSKIEKLKEKSHSGMFNHNVERYSY